MSPRAKYPAAFESPYPVLEERALLYIPRKFLRGARRNLSELPEARPGAALVFRHGSRYVAFAEAKHLTGAEEPVVDAVAVCLVDTRTRQFIVHMPLPSESPADDFTIRATFRAKVTDPERAAAEGPINVIGYLTGYLKKDHKLLRLGSGRPIEAIAVVREEVVTRIEAYCEYHPIQLPGLAMWFVAAEVLTPTDLRSHKKALRDETWQQALDQLRAKGEDASIERLRTLVDEGQAALTALGLAKNEVTVNDAIQNAREDDKHNLEGIAEALRIFQHNGLFDYLDIDPTEMVSAYLEKLTGEKLIRASRDRLGAGDRHGRDAIGSGDEDDEPPDEADLDD